MTQGGASTSDETVVEGVNKGKGVDGTWFGNVSYLAPGKYTVSGTKGVEQQFFVAEDTEIRGYGDICGDADTGEGGQGGTECTEGSEEYPSREHRYGVQFPERFGLTGQWRPWRNGLYASKGSSSVSPRRRRSAWYAVHARSPCCVDRQGVLVRSQYSA
ncbi:hypothetical protein [Streptomyces incanus]|uniref:Uncharacterized protein n=1 Tax=Streptomyces incanus TaxID=887453 RepID=A0ABW0XMM6_9ACTN